MNILFLIGNGFDVNLGMHTSYADFYEYYVNKQSPSKNVETLKNNIAQYKNTNKWSDLEKGLGLYTSEVKSISELNEVYFDINDELKNYLKEQLSTIPLADVKLAEKIKKDLASPGRYFNQRQQKEIEQFISSTSNIQMRSQPLISAWIWKSITKWRSSVPKESSGYRKTGGESVTSKYPIKTVKSNVIHPIWKETVSDI